MHYGSTIRLLIQPHRTVSQTSGLLHSLPSHVGPSRCSQPCAKPCGEGSKCVCSDCVPIANWVEPQTPPPCPLCKIKCKDGFKCVCGRCVPTVKPLQTAPNFKCNVPCPSGPYKCECGQCVSVPHPDPCWNVVCAKGKTCKCGKCYDP